MIGAKKPRRIVSSGLLCVLRRKCLMQTSPVQKQFLHTFASFWRTDPGPYLLAALRRSACQNSSSVRGWTTGGCLVAAWGIQHYIADSLTGAAAGRHVSLLAVATDETE